MNSQLAFGWAALIAAVVVVLAMVFTTSANTRYCISAAERQNTPPEYCRVTPNR